mmetsp:Transcript_9891/g.14293  ORF Transcript_9891/g.14293 Transcript_9891/m.14293 type:complete len:350 (-) Transcript_9891:515-1564(-)
MSSSSSSSGMNTVLQRCRNNTMAVIQIASIPSRPLSVRILFAALCASLLLRNTHITSAYAPLSGISLTSHNTQKSVELANFLRRGTEKNKGDNSKCYSLLIFGTYPADFNAIEYVQRLRYYLPKLKKRGVVNFGVIINGDAQGASTLAECVDLPSEVELFLDPTGTAGRTFGVERGWRPDDTGLSPYIKLFGMLFGLGAWATLPSVIGGYIGNPFRAQPWIEDAIAVGQRQKRWPDMALELDEETGEVKINKFSELPIVGEWKRRPLELATLRLQNMLGISLKKWDKLKPTEEGLNSGVLTQLGGCMIVDTVAPNQPVFEWRDPGICSVANFEDVLTKLSVLENMVISP